MGRATREEWTARVAQLKQSGLSLARFALRSASTRRHSRGGARSCWSNDGWKQRRVGAHVVARVACLARAAERSTSDAKVLHARSLARSASGPPLAFLLAGPHCGSRELFDLVEHHAYAGGGWCGVPPGIDLAFELERPHVEARLRVRNTQELIREHVKELLGVLDPALDRIRRSTCHPRPCRSYSFFFAVSCFGARPISMRRGFASGFFGTRIVRTPSARSAVMCSGSTTSGSVNERSNEP